MEGVVGGGTGLVWQPTCINDLFISSLHLTASAWTLQSENFFAGCEQARNHSASTLQTTPWQESGLVDGWVEDVDSRG